MNSVMNGLMKQLFTPNCPVAQLAEHKTEGLRRVCWPGVPNDPDLKMT